MEVQIGEFFLRNRAVYADRHGIHFAVAVRIKETVVFIGQIHMARIRHFRRQVVSRYITVCSHKAQVTKSDDHRKRIPDFYSARIRCKDPTGAVLRNRLHGHFFAVRKLQNRAFCKRRVQILVEVDDEGVLSLALTLDESHTLNGRADTVLKNRAEFRRRTALFRRHIHDQFTRRGILGKGCLHV